MPAILFDLDGVLYEGDRAIAGAAETVAWFNKHSIPHLYLTNTSSRPRSALVEKLNGFGIEVRQQDFLTPPVAAINWLKQNVKGPIALFIPEVTRTEFCDFELCSDDAEQGAKAVIVGDLGYAWDFATLNRAFRLLINDPQCALLALGMTRYWRANDGLRLDAGAYATALQYATGREPVVMGKPARVFYQTALELLGVDSNDTWMIGDDIKGDIEAAHNADLKAILVKTGKFKAEDLESDIKPDALLDSIADLPDWWQNHNN